MIKYFNLNNQFIKTILYYQMMYLLINMKVYQIIYSVNNYDELIQFDKVNILNLFIKKTKYYFDLFEKKEILYDY
jgi:hypothetical protein